LNWDDVDTKQLILKGTQAIVDMCGLDRLYEKKSIIVFDEIHKYPGWKNFLKGFFDTQGSKTQIIVTGSARLDVYQKGGDSLMGRYLSYRIHPLSVAELANPKGSEKLIQEAQPIQKPIVEKLLKFGGFPEPFITEDTAFLQQWQTLRQQQMLYEDIHEISHIRDTANLKLYAQMLSFQVGQELNYSNMAKKVGVSHESIRTWTNVLSEFYYCFTIQPWHKSIARSLIKQPKVYLCDWSSVSDVGARYENVVASHLLKMMHWYNDLGLAKLSLCYIRTKDQEEVDFLMLKDEKPWFLVEVKSSMKAPLSSSLKKFHQTLKTEHAFQVGFDGQYIKQDIFKLHEPIIVPVQNLLTQLV
jgi:predicted AAA+ superfamily ATPase